MCHFLSEVNKYVYKWWSLNFSWHWWWASSVTFWWFFSFSCPDSTIDRKTRPFEFNVRTECCILTIWKWTWFHIWLWWLFDCITVSEEGLTFIIDCIWQEPMKLYLVKQIIKIEIHKIVIMKVIIVQIIEIFKNKNLCNWTKT